MKEIDRKSTLAVSSIEASIPAGSVMPEISPPELVAVFNMAAVRPTAFESGVGVDESLAVYLNAPEQLEAKIKAKQTKTAKCALIRKKSENTFPRQEVMSVCLSVCLFAFTLPITFDSAYLSADCQE